MKNDAACTATSIVPIVKSIKVRNVNASRMNFYRQAKGPPMQHLMAVLVGAVIVGAGIITPAAVAQGVPPTTGGPNANASQAGGQAVRERCMADPQKCHEEMKARREERCKANPQRCEEMK